MIINLSDLESEFKDRVYEIPADELANRGTIFKNQNVICKLSVKIIKNGFNIFGNLNTVIDYQCVRCLEHYNMYLNLPIRLKIQNEENFMNQNEKLDVIFLSGNKKYLELTNVFADIIELERPIKPLCNEECKGLCNICGLIINISCFCRSEKNTSQGDITQKLKTEKN